jgi:hypothetical protein
MVVISCAPTLINQPPQTINSTITSNKTTSREEEEVAIIITGAAVTGISRKAMAAAEVAIKSQITILEQLLLLSSLSK